MLNRLKSILKLPKFLSRIRTKLVMHLDELDARMQTLEHEALYRKGKIMNDDLSELAAKYLALASDLDTLLGLLNTYGFTSPFLRELATLIDSRKAAAQVQAGDIDMSDASASVEEAPKSTGTRGWRG